MNANGAAMRSPEWLEAAKDAHERAIAESGLSKEKLEGMRRLAGWHPMCWRDTITEDGWFARLQLECAEVEKRIRRDAEKSIADMVKTTLTGGPLSMSELGGEKLRALVPKKLATLVNTYDPKQDGGRIVIGPTGSRKTLSMVALTMRLIRDRVEQNVSKAREHMHKTDESFWYSLNRTGYSGMTLVWARAYDIGRARAQHALGEGEAPLIRQVLGTRLLVIDDLGWETDRDSALSEVLNGRYDAGRPTIATSALTTAELEQKYSRALLRRILESGGRKGAILSLFKGAE